MGWFPILIKDDQPSVATYINSVLAHCIYAELKCTNVCVSRGAVYVYM